MSINVRSFVVTIAANNDKNGALARERSASDREDGGAHGKVWKSPTDSDLPALGAVVPSAAGTSSQYPNC